MQAQGTQFGKTAKKVFLFGKYDKKYNRTKPLISLRGILKGVKVTEKDIKKARVSLFKS